MNRSEHKIVQYLNEAHAAELALVSTLRAHIAMTPRGEYRSGLERHLGETKDHAQRIQRRVRQLGAGRNPLQAGLGLAQSMVGQAVVMTKGPLDMVRGFSPEEKLLKNAKDECATEALEIATYDALERLARGLGDEETARLAAEIRSDEERMLGQLREQLPKLTDAVIQAEVRGQSTYDPSKTGAADAVNRLQSAASEAVNRAQQAASDVTNAAQRSASEAAERARETAAEATKRAQETAAEATKRAQERAAEAAERARAKASRAAGRTQTGTPAPEASATPTAERPATPTAAPTGGPADSPATPVAAEGAAQAGRAVEAAGAASEAEPPFEGYDALSAGQVVARLADLSPDEIRRVDAYERSHKGRVSVLRVTESKLATA